MTDRQTDTRSSCWSITSFDKDEWNRLEGDLPSFVKKVWGGKEECETTKRIHFQGCLETTYCRFSQVKKWLPSSHIEKAIKKEALIEYAMKEETAVEEKKERKNNEYFSLDKFLILIAENYLYSKEHEEVYYWTETRDRNGKIRYEYSLEDADYPIDSTEVPSYDGNFWIAARKVLTVYPFLAHLVGNPSNLRLWKNTADVWIEKAKEKKAKQQNEPISITGSLA